MIRQLKAKVKRRSVVLNEYGAEVFNWIRLDDIYGFMDTLSYSKSSKVDKFMEDSTHIFITKSIIDLEQGDRLEIDSKAYEVNYVDNPLMMNKQLEIELKPLLEQNQTEKIIYFGINNSKLIDEVDIMQLSSNRLDTKAFYKEFETENNGILHLAYPKFLGKSSIRLNNRLVTDWNIDEVIVNGSTFYLYSISVKNGTIKIELF